ncbi:WD40-repeat-containing domain protein [Obelidium mucronatum]|nr:WD40-repeat-containing domain protein [Obelidium mucronatum]
MLDFSHVFRTAQHTAHFSPDARLVATVVDARVVVRDAASQQIAALFACDEAPAHVAWAPDAALLAVATRRTATVWSLADPQWRAVVDAGAAGLARLRWAPDARSLLVFSDFQLRVTVWSLVAGDAASIQHPKYCDRGFGFRADGRYFALCERRDGKDTLSVYDCEDWTLVKHFPVDTSDLEDIAWSPDGRFIAVWDSILEYKILIYSPDGRLISCYSANHDPGVLGIKSVNWSPSAQFLAVGSFDEKLRLINNMTWKPLIDLSHPTTVPYPDIPVYREAAASTNNMRNIVVGVADIRPQIYYELLKPPFNVHTVKVEIDKLSPKKGVGICEFSCDGRYIASRNDNMPNTLWIWDLVNLSQVALIQQLSAIKQIAWNPMDPELLAISCSNSFVYLWSKERGCSAIEVPTVNFQVGQIKWCPDGKSLALVDREKFCIAFLVEE